MQWTWIISRNKRRLLCPVIEACTANRLAESRGILNVTLVAWPPCWLADLAAVRLRGLLGWESVDMYGVP